jgi:hypothetical protein
MASHGVLRCKIATCKRSYKKLELPHELVKLAK